MDKENLLKLETNFETNTSKTQVPGSNFLSAMPHLSIHSRNKEDLFRRLRSGKDILCNLPSRLDPNIIFSEDEDEDTEEIKKDKLERMKPPMLHSTSDQIPSIKAKLPVPSKCTVEQTPIVTYSSKNVTSQSSIWGNRIEKLCPPSITKNRSIDFQHDVNKTKINFMSKPEFKHPNPCPCKQPSKQASNLSEETITVNGKPYRVLSHLGSGGSCKVFLCSYVLASEEKLVAIKRVDLKNAHKDIKEGYKKEIQYLTQLQSSHRVIRMFDWQQTDHELFIVLEKGDIDFAKYLSNVQNRRLSTVPIKFYWTQMLKAVSDIHKHGIVHSDLKPANFLLVEGNLKLIDFGIATSVPDDKTSAPRDIYMGTLNYMSPEAMTQTSGDGGDQICSKVSVKSDVWSLGCILYNLVYGETPFQSITNMFAKMNAITNPEYMIKFKPIPDKLLLDVMKQCLKRNPKERASVDELLKHPYLREEEDDQTDALKSKDLDTIAQLMQELTPRRMNCLSKVVKKFCQIHECSKLCKN